MVWLATPGPSQPFQDCLCCAHSHSRGSCLSLSIPPVFCLLGFAQAFDLIWFERQDMQTFANI